MSDPCFMCGHATTGECTATVSHEYGEETRPICNACAQGLIDNPPTIQDWLVDPENQDEGPA